MVFFIGLALVFVGAQEQAPQFNGSHFNLFIVSTFLFLLRDIAIILFFNFGKNRKRAAMATYSVLAFYLGLYRQYFPLCL